MAWRAPAAARVRPRLSDPGVRAGCRRGWRWVANSSDGTTEPHLATLPRNMARMIYDSRTTGASIFGPVGPNPANVGEVTAHNLLDAWGVAGKKGVE